MTPCTVAHQAPLSIEFSRQEYWSGLPFPSPGDLPDPEIQPGSPELKAVSLPSESTGKPRQVQKTKPMRKALWWAAEWSLILSDSWKGWSRRKVVEFLMVRPILTPSLVVPNGWRWLEGAGTLPLDATVAKTQRDWERLLALNPHAKFMWIMIASVFTATYGFRAFMHRAVFSCSARWQGLWFPSVT